MGTRYLERDSAIDRIDVYAMPHGGAGPTACLGHIWPAEGWDTDVWTHSVYEMQEIIDNLDDNHPHAYSDGRLLYIGIYT